MITASVFSRLDWGGWELILPGAAFFIFFSIFVWVAVRITRMPRPRAKHLAELPFEEEKTKPANASHDKTKP